MMYESTIYTMGMALSRALENGVDVELRVDGTWITGRVVISDGYGVVLDRDGREHSIVQLESISACRIGTGAPVPRLAGGTAVRHMDADAVPEPRQASA